MGPFTRKKTNRRIEPAHKRRVPVWSALVVMSFVACAALLGWGAGHMLDPTVMPIRYVEVRGDLRHVTPRQIRDKVKSVMAGNFFSADTAVIRRTLTALPWVKDAAITRVWPDTLRIAVVEQRPLARWGDKGLVNGAAQVFYPRLGERERALPVLEGPEGDERAVVAHYVEAVSRLSGLGTGIRRLVVDERHAWRVDLGNGIVLVLGRQDFDKRLRRFSRIYPRVLSGRADSIAVVDLRYSNGFAVHWRGAPSA